MKLSTWRNTLNIGIDPTLTWRDFSFYLHFEPTEPQARLKAVEEWIPTPADNGWVVDVANICAFGDLYLDGSASTCYDRYRVNVREFDLQNWQAGPTQSSGWILGSGNIGNINLSDIYGNFIDNQVYHVALVTAFPYTAHDLFFQKTPNPSPGPGLNPVPTVAGEFEGVYGEELLYSPGGGFGFSLYEICANNFDLIFDATATTCENRHRISIAEFDWVNWQDLEPNPNTDPNSNAYNSGWIIESVPDQIVMSDLYTNFQVGKTYRLGLETGLDYAAKDFIFKVKSLDYLCAEAPPNDDRSG